MTAGHDANLIDELRFHYRWNETFRQAMDALARHKPLEIVALVNITVGRPDKNDIEIPATAKLQRAAELLDDMIDSGPQAPGVHTASKLLHEVINTDL